MSSASRRPVEEAPRVLEQSQANGEMRQLRSNETKGTMQRRWLIFMSFARRRLNDRIAPIIREAGATTIFAH
jgi:hypothetical protein